MSDYSNKVVLTTCVIGGTGFIGRAVVGALLPLGRRVVVIGRKQLITPLPAGVDYVQNSADGEIIKSVLKSADEVIDLAYATVPQTSFQDPVNDILVNIPEAVRLFEIISSLPIQKFVWVSSGGTVYGRTTTTPVTEEHTTFPLSPYGITKLAIEKYAHLYYENRGLPVVCVRPSNAFGAQQRPYTGQGFIATAIASILDERELILFGEQGTVRDYLHVDDMARGIVAALLYGIPGEVYNIGSEAGLTNRQIINKLIPLAIEFGRDVKVHILPARPFDVPVNILDCNKLRNQAGWVPEQVFDSALRRTWDWYADEIRK